MHVNNLGRGREDKLYMNLDNNTATEEIKANFSITVSVALPQSECIHTPTETPMGRSRFTIQ